MGGIYLISIIIMGVSWYVGFTMQRRFKEYSQMPIRMTGKEISEKILINDNCYTIINKNGSCFYNKEMLNHFPFLKNHYKDLVSTVNTKAHVFPNHPKKIITGFEESKSFIKWKMLESETSEVEKDLLYKESCLKYIQACGDV